MRENDKYLRKISFFSFLIIICFSNYLVAKNTKSELLEYNSKLKNTSALFIQTDGKTIVINSWNKNCGTCAKQIKILKEAQKDFPDVLFLSYEQTKHKDIAKLLDIQYWTTIVVYKDSKEVVKEIGVSSKDKIYSLIKKEI